MVLVATLNGKRIDAADAERRQPFICPNPECARPVILKRGRIKVAHFAHKPPTDCSWAQGETAAHLEAKKLFRDAFVSRGLRSEVEVVIPSLPNVRRADVMVWSPKGTRAAIELQHTSIGIEEIEARSFSYAREGIAQAWVPFLSPSILDDAESQSGGNDGDLSIARYPARPFERWANAFHFGHLWFYDPTRKALWRGHFDKHLIQVADSSWNDEFGDPTGVDGYEYPSKRWKELALWGPYSLERIKIKFKHRNAWKTDRYNVPAGLIARFVVDGEPE